MHHRHTAISLPVAVAYAGLTLALACEPHRYYDDSYSDYHTWNQPEVGFYAQWEIQTQRPHQDFSRRSSDEQKEYFNYRHSNGDQKDNQKQDNQKQDKHDNNRDNRDNRPNN